MKITKTTKFNAVVTLGLQKGYSKETWTKAQVICTLQEAQKTLSDSEAIYLSAAVSDCQIVLNDQNEPSVKLEFINYPKFPLKEQIFKEKVKELTENLMKRLEQNRVVIIFHDELLMLEVDSDKTDQGIL